MTAPGAEQFQRMAKRADWMEQAACRGHDSNFWHPPKGTNADTYKAKAICAGCPVREVCLQWALENGERQGIWGGVSIDRYARKLRRDGRPPAPNPNRPPGSPIIHGTVGGYSLHQRRGVPICDPCRDAFNANKRRLRAERRAA